MEYARDKSGQHTRDERAQKRNPYAVTIEHHHDADRAAGTHRAVDGQVGHVQYLIGNVHADRHYAPDKPLRARAGQGVEKRHYVHLKVLQYSAANNTEVIANICVPAKVPVVAGEEGICKGCGVATLSISYYDIGYKAGEMAYDILVNGADITTMAIEYAPDVTKEYNAEMCEELGITPPEGYVAIATEG